MKEWGAINLLPRPNHKNNFKRRVFLKIQKNILSFSPRVVKSRHDFRHTVFYFQNTSIQRPLGLSSNLSVECPQVKPRHAKPYERAMQPRPSDGPRYFLRDSMPEISKCSDEISGLMA